MKGDELFIEIDCQHYKKCKENNESCELVRIIADYIAEKEIGVQSDGHRYARILCIDDEIEKPGVQWLIDKTRTKELKQ